MYIKRLTATFGRLENETLELEPGLNIIQAPNEGGKSTWTAFLRVMLYGLNTRDRSAGADKRKYLPWSGSPMQGTMDLACNRGDVTVLRRTARANSPMGSFSAVYTGTGTAAEGLSSADCCEALTGVPLEVFERSAYIRQSGIAVDQSAALERRIAALITTGEEDTSYSDAADRLKKQLTRRRYNKSGILPQLELEIAQLQHTRQETESLRAQLAQAQGRERELTDLRGRLQEQLASHEAADAAEKAAEVRQAQKAYEEAGAKLERLKKAAALLPSEEELEALMSRISALEAAQSGENNFAKNVFDSETRLAAAQAALKAHPLGQYTPNQAEQLPLEEEPRPTGRAALPLAAISISAALAAAIALGGGGWLGAAAAGLGLFGLILLAGSTALRKKQQVWDARHENLAEERQSLLEEHHILYSDARSAEAALQGAKAARDSARSSCRAQWEEIRRSLQSMGAAADDLPSTRAAVRAGLETHRTISRARHETETAQLRWQMLKSSAPAAPEETPTRPAAAKADLLRQDLAAGEELVLLRRHIHTGQGRLQVLGDSSQISAQLAQLEEKHSRIQQEYDAIAMAMDALQEANSRMQSRFSPALGEKSANFFTKLTKGKYNKVLLDRDMNPSAQEAGQFMPRETALLSQGAADQLYLAVRLAICEMVLPAEDPCPILLDDALVTFDDERCAAALEVLAELGRKRQILLFTCQSREAALLKRGTDHHIITL